MTDELQTQNYPREQYQTQAPIGAAPASLAASIALGRLLRMAPHADIASIRFETHDQGEGAYAGPGPYVVCTAAEPDECPSCHTIAGQHPHTEYCRRTAELEHRAYATSCRHGYRLTDSCPGCDADDEAGYIGQTSQPATRTSQPDTYAREQGGRAARGKDHQPGPWCAGNCTVHMVDREPTPLATPTPGSCSSCGQDYDQTPVDCATPERHDNPR